MYFCSSIYLTLFLLNLSSDGYLWASSQQATLPSSLKHLCHRPQLHLGPLVFHSTSVSSQATAKVVVSPTTLPVDQPPEPTPVSSPQGSPPSHCPLPLGPQPKPVATTSSGQFTCLINCFKPSPSVVVHFWVWLQSPTNPHDRTTWPTWTQQTQTTATNKCTRSANRPTFFLM